MFRSEANTSKALLLRRDCHAEQWVPTQHFAELETFSNSPKPKTYRWMMLSSCLCHRVVLRGPRGAGIRRLTGNRKLKATYFILFIIIVLFSFHRCRCINVGEIFDWRSSTIGQTKDRIWWLYPYIIVQFWLLVFERSTDAVAPVML